MSLHILDLNPQQYTKHMIHGEGRDWAETNCYMDVWVELLHAMGHEPLAVMPFTFAIDFEGDQWTFFKCPLSDLDRLYGLDVQELNIWRGLLDCVEEQISRGRHVLVELDSFFLPDTQGTAYKMGHVKTTVAINRIDRHAKRMEYFHNQGYHSLEGADFEQLFLSDALLDDRVLPPYVEFVKPRQRSRLTSGQVLDISIELLRHHLGNRPDVNPFVAFKQRMLKDFESLDAMDIEFFHAYSFATFRQYGAAFELCRTYLAWLQQNNRFGDALVRPQSCFADISASSKVIQFQLARSIARKKPLNIEQLDESAKLWDEAMIALDSIVK